MKKYLKFLKPFYPVFKFFVFMIIAFFFVSLLVSWFHFLLSFFFDVEVNLVAEFSSITFNSEATLSGGFMGFLLGILILVIVVLSLSLDD